MRHLTQFAEREQAVDPLVEIAGVEQVCLVDDDGAIGIVKSGFLECPVIRQAEAEFAEEDLVAIEQNPEAVAVAIRVQRVELGKQAAD